ncbi:hypothetical protein ACELLULO517_05635 [Acidisoma cellulosilytica]|uniref:Uncharacterized protein n=1 Tax=Acidisoma cellulosilyticum TaxID=2802395 RepID=A0A964E2R9_9PROT|nr:hypothetical protein [Acidisoma cellulosilyticum]MCB8879706.1 hypothetical protein [Acidisoma cellulosilyticum]
MKDPHRPRIPLIALWRIPAVIALVTCAIVSRMALGATGPVDLPGGGAPALQELAAAMVVCGSGGDGTETTEPAHHGFALDSRLLLDIAEAIYVLPPVGVAKTPAPQADAVAAATLPTATALPPPPRCVRRDSAKT